MEQRGKHEALLAGIGGSGVVLGGTLLARAGLRKYKYVTRFPNFTTSMRGGPCECAVIFSDNRIACTLVSKGDALIILENSQLKPYEDRLRPGGIIILESTGLKDKVARDDVRVLEVPAVEIATSVGSTLSSGMVLLGAYVQATGVMPPEFVEKELEARFGVTETAISASEAPVLLTYNMEAFRRGVKLAASHKPQ